MILVVSVVVVVIVRLQKSCSHKMLQQIGAFVKLAKVHKQQTNRTRAGAANAEAACGCTLVDWDN